MEVFFEALRKYLRVRVIGVENIPKRGRVIIAPNHSGCAGFDAVVLRHVLHRELKRIPRILTLWKAFERLPFLAGIARKLGMVEASTESGLHLLKKNQMVVVFPEGEGGSFKPSTLMYRLQRFHTGFVRMAILTKTPIIPCVVVGAEETHLNLGRFGLLQKLMRAPMPLPLNLIPLPVKWKIIFLPPISLDHYTEKDAESKRMMRRASREIRKKLQEAIDRELESRKIPRMIKEMVV